MITSPVANNMEWIFWHLLNNQSAGVWRWLFLNLKIREFVEYTHFSAVTQMLATFSPRNGHNRHSLLSRHTTRYKLMQNVNHIPCSFSWRNFASRSACVFYRLSGGIGPATRACLLFESTSPGFFFQIKNTFRRWKLGIYSRFESLLHFINSSYMASYLGSRLNQQLDVT